MEPGKGEGKGIEGAARGHVLEAMEENITLFKEDNRFCKVVKAFIIIMG
ncbi:MAG TPA: hypothetical protein GXX75_17635 [Clostridiales bacterium]|nr:hypothetical protein [Clostridiales bacterium]